MTKNERRRIIAELIESKPIVRQEDIADFFVKKGVPVTQATISRDIHSMGLEKQNINGTLR